MVSKVPEDPPVLSSIAGTRWGGAQDLGSARMPYRLHYEAVSMLVLGEELSNIPVVNRVVRRVLIDTRGHTHEIEVLQSIARESHGVLELIWREIHRTEGIGHDCKV